MPAAGFEPAHFGLKEPGRPRLLARPRSAVPHHPSHASPRSARLCCLCCCRPRHAAEGRQVERAGRPPGHKRWRRCLPHPPLPHLVPPTRKERKTIDTIDTIDTCEFKIASKVVSMAHLRIDTIDTKDRHQTSVREDAGRDGRPRCRRGWCGRRAGGQVGGATGTMMLRHDDGRRRPARSRRACRGRSPGVGRWRVGARTRSSLFE